MSFLKLKLAIGFAVGALMFTNGYSQNVLSGGFESHSIYYQNDNGIKAEAPENKIGSNNYLKLDYQYQKFRTGLQFESYLPVLQGLPSALHSSELVFKYVSFIDRGLEITAGDFYDQFGNGLIFRSYEERTLGLNTAVEGIRLAYNYRDLFYVKGLAGKPRKFMEKAESDIKGVSLSLDIGSLFKLKETSADAEINVINRYHNNAGQNNTNANVTAYSLKGNWLIKGFSLQGEYAYKTADPSILSANKNKDGSALLLEVGFNTRRFGSLLTFRRLEYMQFGTEREVSGIGRDLNYLPALTKQHTFSLASLNPYNTMALGEIGGQLDIDFSFRPKSMIGGRYGTTVSLNASAYDNLSGSIEKGYRFLKSGGSKYFRDANLTIEKKIKAGLTSHLLLSTQAYNPVVIGKEESLYYSTIAALDAIWEVTTEKSFRFELQHLWSRQYLKNWAAVLSEYNLSPNWTFFIGDMYNYEDSGVHYYKAGGSYTQSRTRISLQYGRNREGIICVGGVCLYMPSYTGLNLSLISSF